jgi:GTP pyrophosphokinase
MLSFYVPLAHRLGMARFKMKMEDTAFKILHPEIYTDVSTKLSNWRYQWDRFISRVSERFKAELEKYGIDAEVIGRTKNILSIYRKMQRTGKPFEQIYDTLAIRAIVKTISDCYKAMAVALQFYKPIVKEFDDYIQKPKINGYRSLHLLLEDENKIKFELQIRTEEMHRTAEIGIAAHWNYKEGSKRTETDKFFQWFRENASDSTERFNSQAVGAFFTFTDFKSDIFVITPKGDLKSLPRGATPIDFAFAIHKDIGFHCSGAKVNGQIVPFNYELQNGDRVELMTANHPTVNTDWMKFVQTPKAIAEIRRWIRHQMLSHSIKLGEEILTRTFRKNKISITENTLKTVGDLFNYDDVDKLYAAVGAGKISAHQIIRKLNETEEAGRNEERKTELVPSHNEFDQQPLKGIKVGSINNLMVNFGKCCQPIYGDPIVGYITRGKGISIHRTDCINVRLLRLEPERQIEVEWEEQLDKWYTAGIKVGLTSASHFIEEVTPLLEKRNIKLLNYQMYRVSGGDFYTLVLEVPNIDELQAVIFLLSGMKSVGNVRRLQYGEFKSLIPGRSAV